MHIIIYVHDYNDEYHNCAKEPSWFRLYGSIINQVEGGINWTSL